MAAREVWGGDGHTQCCGAWPAQGNQLPAAGHARHMALAGSRPPKQARPPTPARTRHNGAAAQRLQLDAVADDEWPRGVLRQQPVADARGRLRWQQRLHGRRVGRLAAAAAACAQPGRQLCACGAAVPHRLAGHPSAVQLNTSNGSHMQAAHDLQRGNHILHGALRRETDSHCGRAGAQAAQGRGGAASAWTPAASGLAHAGSMAHRAPAACFLLATCQAQCRAPCRARCTAQQSAPVEREPQVRRG